MPNRKIAPSLMCGDLMNMERTVRELDAAGVDLYHLDVFDGYFVPNIQLGFDFIKQLRAITSTPLDVHMAAVHPENHIQTLARLGVDMMSMHIEALADPRTTLASVRAAGMGVGVAISPETPVESLRPLFSQIDYVCFMTVPTGFAGQRFLPESYERMAKLRELIDASSYEIAIEADGNIGAYTIPGCIESGADWFVAGTSSVFAKGATLAENVAAIRELLT